MFIKTTFFLRKLKDVGKQKTKRILICKTKEASINAHTINKNVATRLYEVKLNKT